MKWTYFGCLFLFCLFFALNVVFCGKSALFSLNQANNRINEGFGVDDDHDSLLDVDKILKRNKRYLLFTGGGISKVISINVIDLQTIFASNSSNNVFFRLFWVFLRQSKRVIE